MLEVDVAHSWPSFDLRVQFTVPPGITALFGPSGAGKTSIARAVAGLLKPDSAKISLGERLLADTSAGVHIKPHQRRVAYIFQEPRLFPHLTVAQNIAYGGQPEPELIARLGIADLMDRKPEGLSGGEAQRVAIARAMATRPDVVVMDEPLSALDGPRREEILPWIEALRDSGEVPILYVSHAVDEVARLADRMVVLKDGHVAGHGPVAEVLADPLLLAFFGPRAAGSVITGKVTEIDKAAGLTRLATSAGPIFVPGRVGALGSPLRLRIPAGDVILATERPTGISALNVLEAEVTAIEPGPPVAVALAAGEDRLLSVITSRSAAALGIVPGQRVFAIVKATAVGA